MAAWLDIRAALVKEEMCRESASGASDPGRLAVGKRDMVITCPECGTSYRAQPDSIGSNGRTVRCARCKETWFVSAADGALAADRAALDEDLQGGSVEAALAAAAPGFGERIAPPAPVGPATAVPAAAPTADVVLRDAADAKRVAGRRRTIRLIWLVAALVAAAGIVTALLNRQAIVNRQPETAALFRAVGADVRLGGLDIDPPVASTALVDGRPVLSVSGAVRNLSGTAQPLPLIEFTLHGEAGEPLAQWFVEPDAARLQARARLPFSTQYADPPPTATGLRYRFAPRG